MFKSLEEKIKELKGNVLVISLDDKLIEAFNKNNKVNLYAIQSNNNNGLSFRKDKKRKTNKGKIINIKKLRKYINKKSTDYIICNMNEMFKYYKYFIKDSIYLNDNIIYLYFDKSIDKDFIINRYKRYNVKIECNEYKNGYILIINNKNGKNKKIKDLIYFIKDTLYNLAEIIGNILIG